MPASHSYGREGASGGSAGGFARGAAQVFYIDLSGVTDRAGLQERLCAALPLPAHYGRNLDALYDALTERGAGWDLIFYRYRALERSQPKYFAALRRLLDEACAETPGLKARFFKG